MSKHFACIWERSDFDTDEDGEGYNTSDYYDYTGHYTLEEAQALAIKGSIGYARYTKTVTTQEEEENYFEPIYVASILVYDNNDLIGLYNTCDVDGWRYYEKQDHWIKEFMTFPPTAPQKDNKY